MWSNVFLGKSCEKEHQERDGRGFIGMTCNLFFKYGKHFFHFRNLIFNVLRNKNIVVMFIKKHKLNKRYSICGN